MRELTFQIAVVVVQNSDPPGESGLGHDAGRVGELLLRDGGRRDTTSEMGGRVDREAAPASADLDDVVSWAEVELATDAVELLTRCLGQGAGVAGEHRARIRHRGVEEETEELVTHVVVGGDVLAVLGLGRASTEAKRTAERLGDRCESPWYPVDPIEVEGEESQQRHQVRAVPFAQEVGLAQPDAATRKDTLPGRVIEDLEVGVQTRRARGSVGALSSTSGDRQRPVSQPERE